MTTTSVDVRRAGAVALIRDGVLTLAAVLLSVAAFDDITTGNETDFTTEYGALLVCAGWLLVVTFRLIRASRVAVGALSFVVLAGAMWAQREIWPGNMPGLWSAYVVTWSACLWFMVVSVMLIVSGWRIYPERRPQRV